MTDRPKANPDSNNTTKHDKKEIIKTTVQVAGGVVGFVVIGFFMYNVVSTLFDYSVADKQQRKQQIQKEYLDSIHNHGYVTDSVYNILKQNTK